MSHEEELGWRAYFQSEIEQLRRENRLRHRGGLASASPQTVDFSSNDYLGLRSHPLIISALQSPEASAWGSGASSVLSGWGEHHASLEHAIADLSSMESAMVFSSGYAASVGTLAALLSPQDLVFSDKLNHACLIDGIRLSKARRQIYAHCDLVDLRQQLENCSSHIGRKLIVTESIFSMDGDLAPLTELTQLAKEFDCAVVVDEAHATGVYGKRGGGLIEELSLQQDVLLKLGTLSKALGGIGGFAAGSNETITFLVNKCRSYLFSTAPPAASMQAALAAVSLTKEMTNDRKRLRSVALNLREQLRQQGWQIPEGDSPIIPVIVGGERVAIELSQRMAEAGFNIPAIRPPTVPVGTCRLRISLSAKHSPEELTRLIKTFGPPSSVASN